MRSGVGAGNHLPGAWFSGQVCAGAQWWVEDRLRFVKVTIMKHGPSQGLSKPAIGPPTVTKPLPPGERPPAGAPQAPPGGERTHAVRKVSIQLPLLRVGFGAAPHP